MNYYQFHVGDYTLRTAHLEPLEDLAYRRLLDLYYLNEKPLQGTPEMLARVIRLRSYAAEVKAVLEEFFAETDEGWRHHHCDEVIAKYQARAAQAATNGKAGGRPRKSKPKPEGNQEKTQSVSVGLQTVTGSKTNQEPITNNQEPEDQKLVGAAPASPKARATRLPADWTLPDDLREWALAERPELSGEIDRIAASFKDYWCAKSGKDATKVDWSATWRNWVRNQKAPAVVRPFTGHPRHNGLNEIDHTIGLIDRGDGTYDF